MYENTKAILEVSRDTDKATKNIAENTADIAVSVVRWTPVVKALTLLKENCGHRNLGQTRSRARRRIPG